MLSKRKSLAQPQPLPTRHYPFCISLKALSIMSVVISKLLIIIATLSTDMNLPCRELDFSRVQKQALMQTPPSPQPATGHWINHAVVVLVLLRMDFPTMQDRQKLYRPLPALRRRMNFKCSGATPILNPSISAACCRDDTASHCLRDSPTEPNHDPSLSQSRHCMNLTTANRRTTNYTSKLNFARFGKSWGAALANKYCQEPKRVAPVHPWAHPLGSLAQPGSGSAHPQLMLEQQQLGSKKANGKCYVEIPISNSLFQNSVGAIERLLSWRLNYHVFREMATSYSLMCELRGPDKTSCNLLTF